jgi:molybdopterin-containing oxidoreductase family iron-sulfur binding subunit
VLATVQTEEGLNAQAYNRCVGTRYCANNCPFKVRRFNWFDYRRDDPVANLVLNPDVVVRTRGVMEKCSFCVQRIENAKIEARRRGEVRVREDEARPACQQTCPADAIVFGDMLDPASRVAASRSNPRGYRLLEELNVQPSVEYLRRVRRRSPGDESHEPDQTEGGASHG